MSMFHDLGQRLVVTVTACCAIVACFATHARRCAHGQNVASASDLSPADPPLAPPVKVKRFPQRLTRQNDGAVELTDDLRDELLLTEPASPTQASPAQANPGPVDLDPTVVALEQPAQGKPLREANAPPESNQERSRETQPLTDPTARLGREENEFEREEGLQTRELVPSSEQSDAITEDQAEPWWLPQVGGELLELPRWVSFDLQTLMLDTLRSSPRIQSVSERTSVAFEAIVQQDAAFDASVLFDANYGRVNDPVGNTLLTGGPSRLLEDSSYVQGGFQRTSRRGTEVDFSQQLGTLDSNSNFFLPINQGNARLSLSLIQPLLDRGGRVYNERLLTQARIDLRVNWQEMRGEVEQRIAEVMTAYWRLYELRCHLLQQTDLLRRAQRIEAIILARRDFDAGRIELAKARQRVARRDDTRVKILGDVLKQQTRLAGLVGAEALLDPNGSLELIPSQIPTFPVFELSLSAAVQQGIENRPEVRAAAAELESAALAISVTRAELQPELTAVVDTYLSSLNGNFDVFRSFVDQFAVGGPGVAGTLQYEMPYRRRAARSRFRQAQHQFRQRSEELREALQVTQAQIETAVVNVQTAATMQATKQRLLATAVDEEYALTRRWEMMAGDGLTVGVVLENVLDAQQRRTDAEREWTSAKTKYVSSLIDLQRAMGTLLIRTGIRPIRQPCDFNIHFTPPDNSLVPAESLPVTERPLQAEELPAPDGIELFGGDDPLMGDS